MQVFLFFLILSFSTFASDLTTQFKEHYKEGSLDAHEVLELKRHQVIFIPGILSESFVRGDYRGPLDFSSITRDYFGTHLSYLGKLSITAKRLKASSVDVKETIEEIGKLFKDERESFIFIAHSLGGMALLDYLLLHPENWERVSGIIFLQSPFTGAPMATVVQKYPFLSRLFPVVHTSTEVVNYLSVETRKDFIALNALSIHDLVSKVKTVTVGGVVNGYKTLFSPSTSIIRTGCLETAWGRCLGPRFYNGPFDQSDGMVPFEASKLPNAGFVRLEGVDHGETVLKIPYRNLDQRFFTAALLRLFL